MMEEETPVKPSVAQLAGRLRGHALPMPGNIEVKSMRKPPCSLQLNNQAEEDVTHEKPFNCPHPPKMKIKSSPLIEKLQANLALSPTVLLSPPKSPEAKQPPTTSNPSSPCSSLRSTLQPTQLSCENELPVSFEQPAEGTPLPSINKSRVRLFKRRLPTRQHRKSTGEGTKAYEENESCQPDSPLENGDGVEALGSPVQEGEEDKTASSYTTSDPEPERQEREIIKNRDVPQESERTEVTKTENEEEGTSHDHQPSDCTQSQEPEQEHTTKDQREITENKELLGTEKTPDEK